MFSDMMHQLPLLTERQYIATVHSRLQDSQPWKLPGLQATVRLAWALALRGISQLPDVTGILIIGSFVIRENISFGRGVIFALDKHEHGKIARVVLNYNMVENTIFFLCPEKKMIRNIISLSWNP